MNCRKGDLALVIGPPGCPSVGALVTCLELYAAGAVLAEFRGGPTPVRIIAASPTWGVDRDLRRPDIDGFAGGHVPLPFSEDRHLMPVRPSADRESAPTRNEAPA